MSDPWLRIKAVLAATGYSRRTLYRRIGAGKFPAGHKSQMNGYFVAWRQSWVLAHIESRDF